MDGKIQDKGKGHLRPLWKKCETEDSRLGQ